MENLGCRAGASAGSGGGPACSVPASGPMPERIRLSGRRRGPRYACRRKSESCSLHIVTEDVLRKEYENMPALVHAAASHPTATRRSAGAADRQAAGHGRLAPEAEARASSPNAFDDTLSARRCRTNTVRPPVGSSILPTLPLVNPVPWSQ